MKLISVNVGLPREVTWHHTIVTTGIFKQPVSGQVVLRKLNLDGDRQGDLRVHGGEYKAVYCYPVEHYAYWKKELPGRDIFRVPFSEKTSPRKAFWKIPCILATASLSVPQKWSSRNPACLATNWASVLSPTTW